MVDKLPTVIAPSRVLPTPTQSCAQHQREKKGKLQDWPGPSKETKAFDPETSRGKPVRRGDD